MIRSIVITNHNKESLTLDLFHPEYSGIIITNIEGLGPPTARINITDMATVDGGKFSSARQQTRNIVFSFRFMMEPTVEDVRINLYRFFPIKKMVTVRFRTDRRIAEATGYVESVTPDIFQENVTCQVSIICPDPNFYSSGDTTTLFAGVIPKFESPIYAPEWGIEDGWPADEWKSGDKAVADTFILGDTVLETTAIFDYRGTVDTGMIMEVYATGMAENITIWNNSTREHITIDTSKIYQITGIRYDNKDTIIISTYLGDRYVKLFHEGVHYDILGSINRDADFFQLTGGVNVFSFQAERGVENLRIAFSYRTAYGGI